jgi:hypothetical protein
MIKNEKSSKSRSDGHRTWRLGLKYKHSKAFVQKQDEKNYEAEVVKRQQGIENARDERELRESQDQRQNSFVENFESGELVH